MANLTSKALAKLYLSRIAETGPTPGYRKGGRAALAYLRALERVASAAAGPHAVTPQFCWGYDAKTRACSCPLHRALAQLAVARGGRRA